MWCSVPCPGADGPVHGIYDGRKGISPEEIWGSSIFHDGPPLVQDLPVGPFSNTILLRHVWYSKLKFDSAFGTVLFKRGIDIFTTMIGP